jgi:phytoene dehydrogenase-like protein
MAEGYDEAFDGIVLGAGHNGLVLQAYLGRAGLRVLALERLPEAGGGLATVEDDRCPGFFHNVHAVFLRGLSALPWYRDLALEARGVRAVQPEVNLALVPEAGRGYGRVLRWYTDLERTCAAIAELSPADAAAWRRIATEFAPVVEGVVGPAASAAPLPPDLQRALLERSVTGRAFLAVEPLTPREFVEQHFAHPLVKAALLYVCVIREYDVHVPGQGALIPVLIASRVKAQLALGGSAAVARGLLADVHAHGGVVWEGVHVRRIVVGRRRATGVELADGRRIGARAFIASSLNPQQTLLDLLGGEGLDAATRDRARAYRYQTVGPLFGLHLALDEAPRYAAAAAASDVDRAFLTILGLRGPEDVDALAADHAAGRPAAVPAIWGTTPTVHDPTQAPPGKHTAFMWQKAPYALAGDPAHWDETKEQHAAAVLARWRAFAPNLTDRVIRNRFAVSPLDTERRFPNMARGDLGVGWMGPGQRGAERPFPGSRPYRTPVSALYLCGACTHPGGNITGLPGYNAARAVAEDLGIAPWWKPPDPEDLWARLT